MSAVRTKGTDNEQLTTIDLEANVTAPEPTMDDFDAKTSSIEAALAEAARLLPLAPKPGQPLEPPPPGTVSQAEEQVRFARATLTRLVEQNRLHKFGPATRKIRATRVHKLAKELSDTVGRLQTARDSERDSVAKRLRSDVERVMPHALRNVSDKEVVNGFPEQMLAAPELRLQYADLAARNDELRRLANSVNDLKELFVDLGIYVSEQQGIINEVENNLQETKQVQARTADKELVEALAYKRRVTKRKMCIAISVIVLIAIIILILFITLR